MFEFGFIGTGNMGGALARAVAKKSEKIILTDKQIEKAEALAEELGAETGSVLYVAQHSKFIFLGVKPQMLTELANEINNALKERTDSFVLVSMLAGKSTKDIENAFGNYPIIRIMPNVACSVGAGMTLCTKNPQVTSEEYDAFFSAMEKSGVIDHIDERLIDASSAVSGCGPAYAFMVIEALADGAVACGVPRDKAYLYASQMLLGSAQLYLKTGKNPAYLKDCVCSPGGTTIQGVRALENGGLRKSLIEAVIASYEKTISL